MSGSGPPVMQARYGHSPGRMLPPPHCWIGGWGLDMITFLCRTLTLPCVRGLKSIGNVLGSASRIYLMYASEWSGNKMLIVVGNWHSGNYKYQNLLGLLQQFSSFHQQSSISLLPYVTKLMLDAWCYILNHGYLRVALLLSSGSVRSYAHDMHSSSKYIQHLFTVSKRSRITFLHVVRIRF